MNKALILAAALLVLLAAAGCTPGPNQAANSPDDAGKTAGFLKGLWHGFIVLFTFIWSLFSDKVHIYEVHNTGGWYNLGYLLGVMAFFGGGGGSACKRSGRS